VLESLFSKKNSLTGAPAVRRMKTYSASSGYVYQYFYEGQRRLGGRGGARIEFVFAISADRATWRPVSVMLPDDAMAEWQAARDRELSSSERHAVAKLALFQAFDERPIPEAMHGEIRVGFADLDVFARTLGWD
jgi:hypothetical protein